MPAGDPNVVSGADAAGLIATTRAAEARATVVAPTDAARQGKLQPQAGAAAPAAAAEKTPHPGDAEWKAAIAAMEERFSKADRQSKAAFSVADRERERSKALEEQLASVQREHFDTLARMAAAKDERENAQAEAELDPQSKQLRDITKYIRGLEGKIDSQQKYLHDYATALEETRLGTQVDSALSKYPDVDREILLSRKFANPRADMMELARKEQERFEDTERRIEQRIIERAKKRAEATRAVSHGGGGGGSPALPRRPDGINLASSDPKEKGKVHLAAREALTAMQRAASE